MIEVLIIIALTIFWIVPFLAFVYYTFKYPSYILSDFGLCNDGVVTVKSIFTFLFLITLGIVILGILLAIPILNYNFVEFMFGEYEDDLFSIDKFLNYEIKSCNIKDK